MRVGEGAIVDIVLSVVLGTLVVLILGLLSTSSGEPLAANAPELGTNISLRLIFLVIGLSSLVLGAFVAGKIARRNHALHGILVGVVSLAVGLLIGVRRNPAWFTVAVVALNFPTAIFGSLLARRKKENLVAGTASGA